MKKTLSFDSPKEHYHDAVAVAWCFDDRFSPVLAAYLKDAKFPHSDVIETAGGAKALAGEAGPERDFVLNQIRLSIALHAAKKAVLMVHVDCGAYGGSKSFEGHDAEIAHHADELNKAEALLKEEFPDLAVEKIVADFDGLYRV